MYSVNEGLPGPLLQSSILKPRRPRLKVAGVAVLEEFARNNPSIDPSPPQKAILLEQIHSIPGCEGYTFRSLENWFQRRRKSLTTDNKLEGQMSVVEHSQSPYPSLTNAAIHNLRILCQGQYRPAHELVRTWATLLNADIVDVFTWLSEQQQNEGVPDEHRPNVYHPPTPVSTSPEPPDAYYVQPLKVDPFHSPVVPYPASASNHEREVMDPLSPTNLLRAIVETTLKVDPPTTLPNTADEFEALFNPYLERMEMIIGNL